MEGKEKGERDMISKSSNYEQWLLGCKIAAFYSQSRVKITVTTETEHSAVFFKFTPSTSFTAIFVKVFFDSDRQTDRQTGTHTDQFGYNTKTK